jgi:hypothetical protein
LARWGRPIIVESHAQRIDGAVDKREVTPPPRAACLCLEQLRVA